MTTRYGKTKWVFIEKRCTDTLVPFLCSGCSFETFVTRGNGEPSIECPSCGGEGTPYPKDGRTPGWVARLQKEYEELTDKRNTLSKYISDGYAGAAPAQIPLLDEQIYCMARLCDALQARLQEYKKWQ